LDWRQEDMMKQSKEMIHTIFSFFAQEENYPIYLHCNIGTDRTGLITYLLGTLIGIPQEDLFRDYLFSNFGNINGSRPSFPKNYIEDLKAYHQKNMYLNVRDYLVSTGVTEEELDQIINIFLYTNE
jgi:protein-tyrosine phosphatase